jgi:malonate decarboxylase alpha subunit
MGSDARGRRHASPAWLKAGTEAADAARGVMPRGRKLVVQMVETFREHMQPAFVERLDAWTPGRIRPHGAATRDDLRR